MSAPKLRLYHKLVRAREFPRRNRIHDPSMPVEPSSGQLGAVRPRKILREKDPPSCAPQAGRDGRGRFLHRNPCLNHPSPHRGAGEVTPKNLSPQYVPEK